MQTVSVIQVILNDRELDANTFCNRSIVARGVLNQLSDSMVA